jgi:hypothetical protein
MDDHWEKYGAGMATYEGGIVVVIIIFLRRFLTHFP